MSNPLEVGGPIPASVGRAADLYSEIRELRLSMDKEVEAVKARENEIKQHIIDNLSATDDTGAAGLKYRAQIIKKSRPTVSDWPALHAFIAKTGRFDLLQKRVSDKAAMDMLEAQEALPGVEEYVYKDVSITKI